MIWFNVQNFLRDTINIYDFMGNDFVHDTSNGKFDFDKIENLGFIFAQMQGKTQFCRATTFF